MQDHSYAHEEDIDDLAFKEGNDQEEEETRLSYDQIEADSDYKLNNYEEEIVTKLMPLSAVTYAIDFPEVIAGLENCSACQVPLRLKDALGVDTEGLGGLLHVLCPHCKRINRIPIVNSHKSHLTQKRVYDINTKFSLGKYMVINEAFFYNNVEHYFSSYFAK